MRGCGCPGGRCSWRTEARRISGRIRLGLHYWRAQPKAFSVRSDHATNYDLVITTVDKAMFRVALCEAHASSTTPTLLLDLGNDIATGNVILGHLGGKVPNRLPNVLDLYSELRRIETNDREAPSCSTEESIRRQSFPVNRSAALVAIELLWTLSRTGSITYHGAFFSLNPFAVTPLRIDPATWAFMGYRDPAAAATAARPPKRRRSRRSAPADAVEAAAA